MKYFRFLQINIRYSCSYFKIFWKIRNKTETLFADKLSFLILDTSLSTHLCFVANTSLVRAHQHVDN